MKLIVLVFIVAVGVSGCGRGIEASTKLTPKSCEILSVDEQCLVTVENTTCGPKAKMTAYDPKLCTWMPF